MIYVRFYLDPTRAATEDGLATVGMCFEKAGRAGGTATRPQLHISISSRWMVLAQEPHLVLSSKVSGSLECGRRLDVVIGASLSERWRLDDIVVAREVLGTVLMGYR